MSGPSPRPLPTVPGARPRTLPAPPQQLSQAARRQSLPPPKPRVVVAPPSEAAHARRASTSSEPLFLARPRAPLARLTGRSEGPQPIIAPPKPPRTRSLSVSARVLPTTPPSPSAALPPREDESHRERWRRLSQGSSSSSSGAAAVAAQIAQVRTRVRVRVHRVDPGAMGGSSGDGEGSDAGEAAYFRSRIASAVTRRVAPFVRDAADEAALFSEMRTTDVPPPAHMPRTLALRFYFRLGSGTGGTSQVQTVDVVCARYQSLKEALLAALEAGGVRAGAVLGRCVVRVHGERRYALRAELLTTPLEAFCHVRECALRRRPLAFVVEPPRAPHMARYLSQSQESISGSSGSGTSTGNGSSDGTSSFSNDDPLVSCIPLSAVPRTATLGATVVGVDVLPPDLVPRGVAVRTNYVDSGIAFAVALAVHYRGAPLDPAANGFLGAGDRRHTNSTAARADGAWAEYVETGVPLALLPREAHLVATLVLHQRARRVAVAWAAATLFDENGLLRAGTLELRMWRGDLPSSSAGGAPSAPCTPVVVTQNPQINALRLLLRLGPFVLPADNTPVCWDHGTPQCAVSLSLLPPPALMEPLDEVLLERAPESLNAGERARVWAAREAVRERHAEALPAVLACAHWADPAVRAAVPGLLARWPRIAPVRALALLGPAAAGADTAVRAYAVACLGALDDDALLDLLPPLVQALRHEPHHYSPLAEFLLVRALRSRLEVGQTLYWLLQAEARAGPHRARYALLAAAYLWACGAQRYELTTQLALVKQLAVVQQLLRSGGGGSGSDRGGGGKDDDGQGGAKTSSVPVGTVGVAGGSAAFLEGGKAATQQQGQAQQGQQTKKEEGTDTELTRLLEPVARLPWPRLSLPTNSSVLVARLEPARSRVMKSAMRPLWLAVASADPVPAPATAVIFKVGDDLRQDMLVLNAFNLMDRLWKQDGLDLRLSTFRCIPTGRDAGFVEVVPNAQTMARIQRDANGLTGALRATSLRAWLEARNPDPDALATAVANFTLSCAGYCVATFVLGIGDRHNDNIMVDHAGHLFHIDFAFFMGRTVKFGFYDREKAPFVLTNGLLFSVVFRCATTFFFTNMHQHETEMATVMGGVESDNFQQFALTCCRAYNVLRHNAELFINLFGMMASAGLAELADPDSLQHLRTTFRLDLSDAQATEHFLALISESLKCKTTLVNFFTHTLANWNK